MKRERLRKCSRFSLKSTFIVFTILAIALGVFARRYHAWRQLSRSLSNSGPFVVVHYPFRFPEHDSMILSFIEDSVFTPSIEEVTFHGNWMPPLSPDPAMFSYVHFATADLDDEKLRTVVEILSQLKKCPRLSLIGTDVTDEGLRELQKLRSLKYLDLTGSNVSAAGVTTLLGTNIRYLNLSHTELTDDDVAILAQFRHLETLDLSQSNVTDSGVNELRLLLPNCTIIAGGSNMP